MNEHYHFVSVPGIGDGNVGAAAAVVYGLTRIGERARLVLLDKSVLPASVVHKIMTRYRLPEQSRTGSLANAIKLLMYTEAERAVNIQLRGLGRETQVVWQAVQEFPVVGSIIARQLPIFWQRIIERLIGSAFALKAANIFIPDVEPKKSAHESQTNLVVWNRTAYVALQQLGLNTTLTAPHIWDEFQRRRETEFKVNRYTMGLPIVFKSSGSGVPLQWYGQLRQELQLTGQEYGLFLPNHTIRGTKEGVEKIIPTDEAKVESRLSECYSYLGGKTQWLIGYPSENVEIVAEMHAAGISIGFIALEPRSPHEVKNLEWARRFHLCAGVLQFDSKQIIPYEWGPIPLTHLAQALRTKWQVQELASEIGDNHFGLALAA